MFNKFILVPAAVILALFTFTSCEEFFNPNQGVDITKDQLFNDWYEYRSAEMGLYGIQAELVEQLVILGELRGDLLEITENADEDMVEVYNFKITKDNKYASPSTFFKLISACNSLLNVLEEKHPEVTQPEVDITNYDKLYGEVLCMRAWAYFNAVRIYGKVPFIYESLTTVEEVEDYINSPGEYVDSVYIDFNRNGWDNDTIARDTTIILEKKYFDQDLVIDYFTNELETKVKAVGVNHYAYNNDDSWEVSIWNIHAMNSLLGIMYLTQGNLASAVSHFEAIILPLEDNRYQLDNSFDFGAWKNIYTSIDPKEHIYTISFDKAYFQQNRFQEFFETRPPHKYMLKPTKKSIVLWEGIWDDYVLNRNDEKPGKTVVQIQGKPGDWYRGYGVSYAYMRGGQVVDVNTVNEVLGLKAISEFRDAYAAIGEVDTVVWKYSLGTTSIATGVNAKDVFDEDANFTIYRAAGIHLWLAEAYVYWKYDDGDGIPNPTSIKAEYLVNDGSYYSSNNRRPQLGVRGRVGFGSANDGIHVYNINYIRDPETNKVIDYIDLSNNDEGLRRYLEGLIIEERARELAFEGERFYDLVRVAKRRNNPSYLAKLVSQKFPPDRRDEMYNYLLDEENWYIHYFD